MLFDGNAQDFHIGLDDTADDLVIGVGSTLGTTTAIAIDENANTTFSGTVTVGVDNTGKDVKLFGATSGSYWLWDESADGVVQIGTLTVGVDNTGHDVKFFGATASAYMLWDESADDLILAGAAGLTVAGATALNGDVTLGGTTPTLTIGDAGAEDAAIVFDGNAQDFHIGLDDTADDLVIGLGSALGTTTHMAFDETGAVTKPLQPCFSASATGTTNIAHGATIAFGTERFDPNGDYNTTNSTFTCPVAGIYMFTIQLRVEAMDSDVGYIQAVLLGQNDGFNLIYSGNNQPADATYTPIGWTAIAECDASDTITILWNQSGGTEQMDISAQSYFAGYYLG